MHARHYSPSLGRFLQPDPSRLDAQLFVYAGNGPVSRVDPSGLDDWWQSYRYYRSVRFGNPPSPVVLNLFNWAASVSCAVGLRNFDNKYAVVATSTFCWLAANAAQMLVAGGNVRVIHEVRYTSGRVIDMHWDTTSNGRTHYWSFTYRSGGGYTGARNCADVILGRINAFSFSSLCGMPVARENRYL
jgi:hypothetical protein